MNQWVAIVGTVCVHRNDIYKYREVLLYSQKLHILNFCLNSAGSTYMIIDGETIGGVCSTMVCGLFSPSLYSSSVWYHTHTHKPPFNSHSDLDPARLLVRLFRSPLVGWLVGWLTGYRITKSQHYDNHRMYRGWVFVIMIIGIYSLNNREK